MDLGPRRYETFDDLYEYLHSRRVGGRAHLPRDLRLPRSASRQYAIDLGVALQLTNILRDVRGDLEQGRVYIPQEDLRAHGCTEDDLRAGVRAGRRRRAVAGGEGAAAAAGAARPGLLRARGARAAAARRAAARGRGDHGGHLSRRARRHRASATTTSSRDVVRIPRPRRALIAASTWVRILLAPGLARPRAAVVDPMTPDVVVVGGGFAGLSRRRGARRARPARAGARCAAAARRPGDRVSPIARPASSSTTGSTCSLAATAQTFEFLRRDRRSRPTCACSRR